MSSDFQSISLESSSFFESNTSISKFAFFILVIIAFVLLLRVGIQLIGYMLSKNHSPHLIDGMVDGKQMIVFPQDPNNNNSVPIYRSDNQTSGIEFTWSVWIYINNLQYLENQYKTIFFKGNNDPNDKGISYPNNAPGLYIEPNINNLRVIMNTFSDVNEEVQIYNVPLNKWLNIIIRCSDQTLDVFVNGNISRSITLLGVPKQNYGDVFVGSNGGFDGNISNLWYYNYAISNYQIQDINKNGPNLKMLNGLDTTNKYNNYLSLRWYVK
jgi:hypothetical protein